MRLGFLREVALIGGGALAVLFAAPLPRWVAWHVVLALVAHAGARGLRAMRVFRRTDWGH